MRYGVSWRRPAIDQLNAILGGGATGDAVMRAVWAAEALLGHDPLNLGESRRTQHDRVMVEWPLAVSYQVDEQARTVSVIRVVRLHRGR